MNKAAIQTLINGRSDAGANPISTERTLWEALTNEFYSPIYPNKSNGTIVTDGTQIVPTVSSHVYDLNITKSGNKVFVNGYITTGASVSGGSPFINFIDNDYKPKAFGSPQQININKQGSPNVIFSCYLDNDQINAGNPISNGTTLIVSFFYYVND